MGLGSDEMREAAFGLPVDTTGLVGAKVLCLSILPHLFVELSNSEGTQACFAPPSPQNPPAQLVGGVMRAGQPHLLGN